MRILILRLSSLGDIVLLGPVIQDIKRAYPQAWITCVVKGAFAGLLLRDPLVDCVVVFDSFWKTLWILRQGRWDAILDLHAKARTRLLTALLPAKWKITYDKDIWNRYRMVLLHKQLETRHTLDRYRTALKSLGIGIRRVAVLQTALMGDVVLTLPMLHKLRERLNCEVLTVVCRPEYAGLLQSEGFEAIEDDKRGKDRGWKGFRRLLRVLREGRFDLVISPQRSLRSALLAWLAGVPLRAGFTSSAGWFLWNRLAPFEWPEHDAERNIGLLDAVPLPAAESPQERRGAVDAFRIRLEKAGGDVPAAGLWRQLGVDPNRDYLIGMAPGASRVTKRWLVERFEELAVRLAEKLPGCRLMLMGGEDDRALCERIASVLPGRSLNVAGRIAIGDLPGVIGGLRLFISNDSGPMHIAWTCGVPTVAIFGPTVRGFGFFPRGPLSRVVEAGELSCRPCSLHGGRICPRAHFLCMRLITVAQVLDVCEEVLTAAAV